MSTLLLVAGAVFLLNLPFGFWRARTRRFSCAWFVAIHAPVPLTITMRIYFGLGWQWITFPILVGAFFAGQFVGARVSRRFLAHP